jgi:hypothetical protein
MILLLNATYASIGKTALEFEFTFVNRKICYESPLARVRVGELRVLQTL